MSSMKNRELFRIVILTSVWLFFSAEIFAQDEAKSVVQTMNNEDLQWGPCPEFLPDGCEIAVLHGDPAKRNVDIFFKVPANSIIPNHAHTSAERMILVSGEMEVTYEGEEPQQLKVGSYAYGPAKKPHTARCGNEGPCVLFIAFEEPLDAYAVEK
jgi:quercetin dioxygenase-like cupin family protein